MAEDIRSMRIELSMKDMGIKRTVAQINQSFRALKSEVSASNKIFQYGEKDLASYKNHVKELDAAHKVSQKNLSDLKRSYNELTDEQKTSSREGLAMQKSIAEQEKELHFLGRQLESAQSELKEFQKAQKIDSSSWTKAGRNISSMGDSLKGVSAKMGEVGSSLTSKITKPALVAASAVGGIALAKGWSRLVEIDNAKAKLSALGNSGKNVEKIMVNANTAVKGTSFGMGEAATTAANAVAAGIKPGKELTQYLTNTGDAAAVAGVGMDEMGRILNKVQTSNKAYNGELQELSDRGLPIYQWLGKEANVSGEEVVKMAEQGKISSEMLQSAIENNIGGAAKKMGEKSFTASLANMWAALGRVGAGFLDAGGKGGGFFSKMKPLMNNLTTMFDGMQGSAEKWGVAFGNVLTAVVNKGVQLKNFYDGLPGPIQSVIKNTVLWGSMTLVAIGPMLLAFSKIAGAVSAVFGPFSGLLINIGKIRAAMGPGVTLLEAFASVFPKLGMVLGAVTGPVGLVVLAVAALGTALVIAYKKSETFRNIVNAAFEGIKNAVVMTWNNVLKPIFMAMGSIFKAVWGQIQQAAAEILPVIKQNFGNTFSNIGAVVKALLPIFQAVFNGISAFIQYIMPGIKAVFQNTFQGIKNIVMGVTNVILGIVKVFVGLFTGNFKLMWSGVKQIFSGFIGIIVGFFKVSFIGQIISFARGMYTKVRQIFINLWNGTKSIFVKMGMTVVSIWLGMKNKVVNFARNIWNGVKANFNNLKNSVIKIFTTVKNWVVKTWTTIKNSVISRAKSLWTGVRNHFSNLWKSIKSIFNNIKNFALSVWSAIRKRVVAYAKSLWTGVRSHFSNLWKSIRSIFSKLKTWLINTWNSIKNRVVNLAKSIWTGVRNKFNALKKSASDITQKLKNAVVDKWRSIKKNVVNLANNAKDGVVKGFKAMYNKGKDWLNKLKEFIGNAKEGFKKVASKLGKSVANGAISGLNAMIDGINTLSDKIMNKKLIKKKIPKLSTGTGANPLVKTDSQGRLTRSTKAVVNDKGIGNARGPGGHKELIRRRNGRIQQLAGSNRRVTLHKGDAVYNGAQSKTLRAHLSTGTGIDLLKKGKKHHKHDEVFGDMYTPRNSGNGGGSKNLLETVADGAKGAWKWTKEKAKQAKDSFGKKIGDVMDYVTNPGKLINKMLKHFGVDFSNVKGEAMGGTISWAYEGLKKGLKDLVGSWLEEAGGGDSGYLELDRGINFGFAATAAEAKAKGYPFPRPHHGIDINYPYGTTVRSTTGGTAEGRPGYNGGFGNSMWVEAGKGLRVIYGHLSKLAWTGKKKVNPGTVLGKSGGDPSRQGTSAGDSTGPHLHYEMQKNGVAFDPMSWLKKHNGGGSQNKSASKWKSDIKRAAKQMKVNLSNSELNGIVAQIQRESNGNAGVTQGNIGDINNLRGTPAQGLLQYVPSTFKSYAVKGHKNIKNGYDQLLAFFNNSNWRRDLPYGKSGWGPSGHRRFATGGIINSNGLYNLAEDGHPEVVVPLDPARATDAMKLISYAQSKVNPGKNKRPNQVSNSYNTGSSNNDEMMNLLVRMVANQQEEINILKQIAQSNANIEQQPKGYNEQQISRDQGKRSVMQAYATGLL
ncbi:peptidoglycan DD-metalloendopeptidase family protein [Staphylococcus gallinarum]|uniref:peptidoglycan DD-metalloendopeptidase family protein n=1 Tax=Staphylococcus gallinarum TaxID=1293 RepID=UPI001E4C76B1|nr:peptidoglycan DD-metalloendopeptidase family protein [Staphylococcus gallinarum]UEH02008.1 peptidoglycan DD-metalloendopeptidase family protein [Staphylococcus gallinarum]